MLCRRQLIKSQLELDPEFKSCACSASLRPLPAANMGIDLLLLQNDKGGDIDSVIASQKKRFASTELVTEVLNDYKDWVKGQCVSTSFASTFSVHKTSRRPSLTPLCSSWFRARVVSYARSQLQREINGKQKEIGMKKRVSHLWDPAQVRRASHHSALRTKRMRPRK